MRNHTAPNTQVSVAAATTGCGPLMTGQRHQTTTPARKVHRMADRLSMSVRDAAEYTGVSRTELYAAIKRGDLIARYPTTKAVIETQELQAWLQTRPTESPRSTK